jgi:hypothetical protein
MEPTAMLCSDQNNDLKSSSCIFSYLFFLEGTQLDDGSLIFLSYISSRLARFLQLLFGWIIILGGYLVNVDFCRGTIQGWCACI